MQVHVFEVTTLNSTHYAEVPVPMGVDPVSLSINKTSWNSERHHHVDAHFLNGEFGQPCTHMHTHARQTEPVCTP